MIDICVRYDIEYLQQKYIVFLDKQQLDMYSMLLLHIDTSSALHIHYLARYLLLDILREYRGIGHEDDLAILAVAIVQQSCSEDELYPIDFAIHVSDAKFNIRLFTKHQELVDLIDFMTNGLKLPKYLPSPIDIQFNIQDIGFAINSFEYQICNRLTDVVEVKFYLYGEQRCIYVSNELFKMVMSQFGLHDAPMTYYNAVLRVALNQLNETLDIDIALIQCQLVSQFGQFALLRVSLDNCDAIHEVFLPNQDIVYWCSIFKAQPNLPVVDNQLGLQLSLPVITGAVRLSWRELLNLQIGDVLIVSEQFDLTLKSCGVQLSTTEVSQELRVI